MVTFIHVSTANNFMDWNKVAVSATGRRQVLPKIRQICQRNVSECTAQKSCSQWHRERDSLEDDEHAGQPRMVRNELKIQELAALVRANCSQTVDEVAAAAVMVLDTEFYLMT
jgi:hypothetical protein